MMAGLLLQFGAVRGGARVEKDNGIRGTAFPAHKTHKTLCGDWCSRKWNLDYEIKISLIQYPERKTTPVPWWNITPKLPCTTINGETECSFGQIRNVSKLPLCSHTMKMCRHQRNRQNIIPLNGSETFPGTPFGFCARQGLADAARRLPAFHRPSVSSHPVGYCDTQSFKCYGVRCKGFGKHNNLQPKHCLLLSDICWGDSAASLLVERLLFPDIPQAISRYWSYESSSSSRRFIWEIQRDNAHKHTQRFTVWFFLQTGLPASHSLSKIPQIRTTYR